MVKNETGGQPVSVIVCTYNGELFLHEQLKSILNQSHTDLEVIIFDDGSTDQTVEIARQFAAADGRVRVHRNPANLGYNENFAQAFGLAQHNFIAISDQDDIWKPEKIEEMMPLFEDEETLLVHCQSVRFSGKPPQADLYTARTPLTGGDPKKTLFFNTIAGHNIIFRRKLLADAEPFPKNIFYDWWLVIHAATFGKVNATSRVLGFHRSHGGNVTLGKKDEGKQTFKKAEERTRTLEAVIRKNILNDDDQEFAVGLYNALKTFRGKEFSWELFRFLVQHSATLFFFKKKKWPSVSHLKMAWRHSFAKK